MIRCRWLLMLLAAAPALSQEAPAQEARRPAGLLFQESFDDADLLKRG